MLLDIGTDEYDTSKKQRIPAYCDRIFLGSRSDLTVDRLSYERLERKDSDHRLLFLNLLIQVRPVTAFYLIDILKINEEK
jgi:hypothetical protein